MSEDGGEKEEKRGKKKRIWAYKGDGGIQGFFSAGERLDSSITDSAQEGVRKGERKRKRKDLR